MDYLGEERRTNERWPEFGGIEVTLDGHPARLIDLGYFGAQIFCKHTPPVGTKSVLVFPWYVSVNGTVVGSTPSIVRMQFEAAVMKPEAFDIHDWAA